MTTKVNELNNRRQNEVAELEKKLNVMQMISQGKITVSMDKL
jgi:hypothetical protein